MKKLSVIITLAFFALASVSTFAQQRQGTLTMSKEKLLDKIKGCWAGKTIGVTYSGPTEGRWTGGIIQDYIPIEWPEHYIKWSYEHRGGLYDDLYMDLTFVDVIERCGLDAPIDSFAVAFSTAEYPLWHGNQAARYNILQGISPSVSGSWKHSAHADDIDYQIEADFTGVMSPGMPNAASAISDKVGHMISSGAGYYGGVYVGAMISLAFRYDDVETVVTEALKTIPQESRFHQCMTDVISWYHQYPDDWKSTWWEIEKKYDDDRCPNCIFVSSNIDAMLNCAYVVLGLLYGNGDFTKTIDISTRCGMDSDCNPSTAGGILGTIIGYSRIPEFWMKELYEAEDLNFSYIDISLNKAYQMSFNHALQMIQRNHGEIYDKEVVIKLQEPEAVPFEESYPGMYPYSKITFGDPYLRGKSIQQLGEVAFEGNGIVVSGSVKSKDNNYIALLEVYLDGQLHSTVKLPAKRNDRCQELYYNPELMLGNHTIYFKWLNPAEDVDINAQYAIVYSNKPYENPFK